VRRITAESSTCKQLDAELELHRKTIGHGDLWLNVLTLVPIKIKGELARGSCEGKRRSRGREEITPGIVEFPDSLW
jgi:hypothetical protein